MSDDVNITSIFNNFKQDCRDFLIELFNDFIKTQNIEITKHSKEYLKDADYKDLLKCYIYNMQRLPCGKKAVYYSKEILKSKLYKAFKKKIDNIQKCFEKGSSILPYLSTHSNHLTYNDYMLNDWGIIHLHIHPLDKRTKYNDNFLLFTYVWGNNVFFLDVRNHSNFADKDLLDILDRNWQGLLDGCSLKGIPLSEEIAKQDIISMRKSKIIYPIVVNNKSCTPQIFQETKRMLYAIAIDKILYNLAYAISSCKDKLQEAVIKQGKEDIVNIHITFDRQNSKIICYDSNSSIGFHFENNDELFSDLIDNLKYYGLFPL
ncbi:MAG: hypothetical protein E7020_05175 [Alphaproteobacteria bacterium]|nr:hypothetical protein [Alphaproteobacteria bacterium]